jgi:hypothetical protein
VRPVGVAQNLDRAGIQKALAGEVPALRCLNAPRKERGRY